MVERRKSTRAVGRRRMSTSTFDISEPGPSTLHLDTSRCGSGHHDEASEMTDVHSQDVDLVAERREALAKGRQAEIEAVVDRHDTLVRELFHLDKFVSMVYYDPKEAKADESNVFQQYIVQNNMDLASQVPGSSVSRRTRRQQNDRIQALKATTPTVAHAHGNHQPSAVLSAPPGLMINGHGHGHGHAIASVRARSGSRVDATASESVSVSSRTRTASPSVGSGVGVGVGRTRRAGLRRKGKEKESVSEEEEVASTHSHPSRASARQLWKGKGKDVEATPPSTPTPTSAHASTSARASSPPNRKTGRKRVDDSVSVQGSPVANDPYAKPYVRYSRSKLKMKTKSYESLVDEELSLRRELEQLKAEKRRREEGRGRTGGSRRRRDTGADEPESEEDVPNVSVGRTRRRGKKGKAGQHESNAGIDDDALTPSTIPRLRIIPRSPPPGVPSPGQQRPTVSGKTVANWPPSPTQRKHAADSEPTVSVPRIKRIKLLVHKPPPSYSHPRQFPQKPKFDKSLETLLKSYTDLDEKEFDEEGLEEVAKREADVWVKYRKMVREGRPIISAEQARAFRGAGANDTSGSAVARTSASTAASPAYIPVPEKLRPHDVWSTIVQEASWRHEQMKARKPFALVVTGAWAKGVKAYWDNVAKEEAKAKVVEERRSKVMAKEVLRTVLAEWARVVIHIREQERKLAEEEAKRLGGQHLDALLNKSGVILGAQQMEMAKAVAGMRRGESDDGEDEDEDGGEEQSGEEGSSEEEDDETDGEREADSDDEDEVETVEAGVQENGPDAGVDVETPSLEKPEDGVEGSVLDGTEDHDREEDETSTRDDELVSESKSVSEIDDADVGSSALLLGVPVLARSGSRRSTPVEVAGSRHESDMDLATETEMGVEDAYVELQVPLNDVDVDVDDMGEQSMDITREPSLVGGSERDTTPTATPVTKNEALPVHDLPSSDDPVHTMTPVHDKSPTDNEVLSASSPSLVAHETFIGKPEISAQQKEPKVVVVKEVVPSPRPVDTLDTSAEQVEGSKEVEEVVLDDDVYSGVEQRETEDVEEEEEAVEEQEEEEGEEGGEEVDSEDTSPIVALVKKPAPVYTEWVIPHHLKPFTVAQVNWEQEEKLKHPVLLRGTLRPYQQSGLEWLASLHNNNMNGILADEMGLGKTIQTIALLAHLACDRGIWGPHLIIVPTSVLLNWEMEFKKFLPGFKILSYHGTTKRRKELRQGWYNRYKFNVCVTSYSLASRDAKIFKRKPWYYMILDEAHMIKNFKSQRWNTLLMFKSFRRLLLTGTPLQNNLTELWSLLQFLMSGTNFVNLKVFGEWFSNPLERAIEEGTVLDEETQQRVTKLHTVLRPYLLRRLKRDVEKELPSKYEHLVRCRLSKRQRFLYDEFMSRAQTRADLSSGIYQKIANILMQLRKVCNHPDLFEVRPIMTSFAMDRSAIADFEIKELLVRRRFLCEEDEKTHVNLDVLGLRLDQRCNTPLVSALETSRLEESITPFLASEHPGPVPVRDVRTIAGYKQYAAHQRKTELYSRWTHMSYINRLRCNQTPVYSQEMIGITKQMYTPLLPRLDQCKNWDDSRQVIAPLIMPYEERATSMFNVIEKFAFATPPVVARDLPDIALRGVSGEILEQCCSPDFDAVLHHAVVKLQIAFPDKSLLQYDSGKLQELARLLRERKSGGHRVLIFTQMTRILDILEIFLNNHGYLYLRLDGATKIEDRQYITERFNSDERIFAFISSSRSGGVGINLTGADTVIFYDSDFNPQMDRQCEDRAHRIGQIRDVHIYRFISQYTVEEAMLRKANQKRSLDDIVIQKGEFDWRTLFGTDETDATAAIQNAIAEFEDAEDLRAAQVAAKEAAALEGEDMADFADNETTTEAPKEVTAADIQVLESEEHMVVGQEEENEDDHSTIGYMLSYVQRDWEFFSQWNLKL